jgi:hypothetical protein
MVLPPKPFEGAPSGINTDPQQGNYEFLSMVLSPNGRVKPSHQKVVMKKAAQHRWRKNKSAKTPRKPVVASISGKDGPVFGQDAADLSAIDPLSEEPSQSAPFTLANMADPSISSQCGINQERSRNPCLIPRDLLATTHDGQPPKPEMHWQRDVTTRADCNNPSQSFRHPLVVAGENGSEELQRGSRKRKVSVVDSQATSRGADGRSWESSMISMFNTKRRKADKKASVGCKWKSEEESTVDGMAN